MPAKQAEVRVRDWTNRRGYFHHKYGDVRYCIHCNKPLPKSEKAPDFFVGVVGTWVEAKNNDKDGTWAWSEIAEGGSRANQREFLKENGGWLFIELGAGKAPNGKSAYLLPFKSWMKEIEPVLIQAGMQSIRKETTFNKDGSIRRLGADSLLAKYRLVWEQGGWEPPIGHIWWSTLCVKLESELEKVRSML